MRVLDVATGCGNPAIRIAKRVGPGGRVVATDSAADMLEAAGRFAKAAGVAEILERRVMDMNAIDLEAGSFDAATYSFALMFAPDPAAVMTSIHRVLGKGGRFALCVWDEPEKNPFFTTVFSHVAAIAPPPSPPPPNAPGVFRRRHRPARAHRARHRALPRRRSTRDPGDGPVRDGKEVGRTPMTRPGARSRRPFFHPGDRSSHHLLADRNRVYP
jgi:SAM-dependent methyltransferase